MASSKEVTPGLANIKNIIAVASGKGGVGKSTVAVNLACELARKGARVGLLDADIYGPSQPGMLGSLWEEPKATEAGYLVPPVRHGVSFVSMGLLTGQDSPVVWRAPMAMKMIQQFLMSVLWGELDYLVIDLPPGTGDVQITLAQQSRLSGALIVSTPQEVALAIAKKGLKMFEQVKVPILGLVENMSGYVCNHCGKESEIFKSGGAERMAADLKVPLLGRIPLDKEVVESGDSGTPVVLGKRGALSVQAFEKLADALVVRLSDVAEAGVIPRKVERADSGKLAIDWSDGHQSQYRAYDLRMHCGCAFCIDENTGRKILEPSKVPLNIEIQTCQPVGRYALSIQFSDGHSTGIYSYDRLLEIEKKQGETQGFSV